MNKFLALFLTVTGFAMVPLSQTQAHEAAPARLTVPINGTNYSMPTTVRVNETVVVERRRHHRRYRTVRRRIVRRGHVTYVTKRIYY